MARFTSFFATAQDPIYGISLSNITKELTASNWENKAIVRDGLYLWQGAGRPLAKAREHGGITSGFIPETRKKESAKTLPSVMWHWPMRMAFPHPRVIIQMNSIRHQTY